MALSAKIEIRQGQQLVMTPQLQQAIKLLQFSNIELAAYVDAELERNPLLERDERDEESFGSTNTNEPNTSQDNEDNSENWLDLSSTKTLSTDLDTDYGNVYADSTSTDIPSDSLPFTPSSYKNNNFNDGATNIEAYISSDVSLHDHLNSHLQLCLNDPSDLLIGCYIIDMVDEAGYIVGDLTETATKLGVSSEHIEHVLSHLQTIETAGIPARNLAECLRLQLQELNRFDPLIDMLLENLNLLAAHKIGELKRIMNVSMEELMEMIAELKSLDPKPGLRFGSTPVQPVVPDVIVRPSADGNWIVELNTETLPKVLIDRTYYTTVSRSAQSSGDKHYLQDCLQTANWLVKSLDQRARTILRVAQEIVRQQDGFFMHGVQYLRPLNLKTVADAISMHESTISRVTSNKYMATPRGILELKYFFSSAIASADEGDAHSSEAVRHRIKNMIDNEHHNSILSDDKIVERLKREGIDIARRTVAKYREAMRIPSSVQRRREKRLRLQA